MINTTKIYRIENEISMHGMWYKENGEYDPFIMRLTDGKSKDLPMEFHERYFKHGFKWVSGCTDKDMMRSWFSNLDAFELLQNGYKLFEIDSQQFIREENQILFTRQGIISKQEIPIESIWDVSKLSKEKILL